MGLTKILYEEIDTKHYLCNSTLRAKSNFSLLGPTQISIVNKKKFKL